MTSYTPEHVENDTITSGTNQQKSDYSRKLIFVILILIGLCGIFLRIYLYQQPVNSDDINYFIFANADPLELAEHTVLGENINSRRIFLIFPIKIIQHIFGFSLSAYYVTVYFFSAIIFIAIIVFTLTYSGYFPALLVSFLWVTSFVFIQADTRIAPDNFGTGLALLGLTCLASSLSVKPNHWPGSKRYSSLYITLAFLSGFLFWASYSVRSTFAVFAMAGGLAALLDRKRYPVCAAMILGFLLASACEAFYFWVLYGDPFERLKLLFGYGGVTLPGEAVQTSSMSSFKNVQDTGELSYTYILLRYPMMLLATGSGEFVLFIVGFLGLLLWALEWRQPASRLKLLAFIFSFGFIAFGLVNINPPAPIMREKLRYYATAAPLFYIAAADLGYRLLTSTRLRDLIRNFPRLGRFNTTGNRGGIENETAFPKHQSGSRVKYSLTSWLGLCSLVVILGLLGYAIVQNYLAASRNLKTAINGNDGILACAQAIKTHQGLNGLPARAFIDIRTSRVASLSLGTGNKWTLENLGQTLDKSPRGGYLLFDWRRLNTNVLRSYQHSPVTHALYRTVEKNALVYRHRWGKHLTDAFFAPSEPLRRNSLELTDCICSDWTILNPSNNERLVVSADQIKKLDPGKILYSGEGLLWKSPGGSAPLPGDRFFEVVFEAQKECCQPGEVLVELHYWTESKGNPVKQYMGQVMAEDRNLEMAAWTYLPYNATSFRIVFRNNSPHRIDFKNIKVFLLERCGLDSVGAQSGLWAEPESATIKTNKNLAACVEAVKLQSKHAQLPNIIYTSPCLQGFLDSLLPGPDRWSIAPIEQTINQPDRRGYLLLDWQRFDKEWADSAGYDPQNQRFLRTLETAPLLFRYLDEDRLTDVFTLSGKPLEREVVEVTDKLPRSWSTYDQSKRRTEAFPSGKELEVDGKKWLYSGEGMLWRAASADGALPGGRFIQIFFDARAKRGGSLFVYLYYWTDGEKGHIRQLMGNINLDDGNRSAVLWTYLPRDATSFRIAFRSRTSTRVSLDNLRLFLLGRTPADRTEQEGGAW